MLCSRFVVVVGVQPTVKLLDDLFECHNKFFSADKAAKQVTGLAPSRPCSSWSTRCIETRIDCLFAFFPAQALLSEKQALVLASLEALGPGTDVLLTNALNAASARC